MELRGRRERKTISEHITSVLVENIMAHTE
jgi:hypothetical protein